MLHGYRSAHGGGVRDRRVEPFAFTTNYVQVWCYDPESGFEQALQDPRVSAPSSRPKTAWEHAREPTAEGFIDAFRMHGGATPSACGWRLGAAGLQPVVRGVSARRTRRPPGWAGDAGSLDTEVAGMAGRGALRRGAARRHPHRRLPRTDRLPPELPPPARPAVGYPENGGPDGIRDSGRSAIESHTLANENFRTALRPAATCR